MSGDALASEVATWTRYAIVIFCVAVSITFVIVASRRLWAGSRASLIVGSGARMAFVVGTFAVSVVVAIAICDLAIGVETRRTLGWSLAGVSVYFGGLLGFHTALKLDPVTEALTGKGGGKNPPELPVGGTKGLRKIAAAPGELCWTCGEPKTSPKHAAGCPAAKEGGS